jgi:hypothetical protein
MTGIANGFLPASVCLRKVKPVLRFKPLPLVMCLVLWAAAWPVLWAADGPVPAAGTSTVSGTLIDADGKAIDVETKVKLAVVDGRKIKVVQIVKLTAEDKGAYTFGGVAPGKYMIAADSKLNGRTLLTKHPVSIVVEAGKGLKVDPITMYPH